MVESTEYKLLLYNADGVLIKSITRQKEKQAITTEEKKYTYQLFATYYEKEWTKAVLNQAIQYPENRPYISDVIMDENNWIYVRQFRSILERNRNPTQTYDLFDENGIFKMTLKCDIAIDLICEKHMYRIKSDDDSGDVCIEKYLMTNYSEIFGI